MTGTILMICGGILLLIGFVIFNTNSREEKQLVPDLAIIKAGVVVEKDSVVSDNNSKTARKIKLPKKTNAVQKTIVRENKSEKSSTDAGLEMSDYTRKCGLDFEKFIILKFNKKYFKVKEWAGDKYVDGVYAETTLNPDMVLEFKLGDDTELFSVECKWRHNFSGDGVVIAKEFQLAWPLTLNTCT